jgi:squalene-hopene/tetraprenyl-beta-curcumene cyclase
LVHQLESGGWGEADASAVQTAWTVLALVAAGQADHDATRRAIDFLAGTQQGDGTWSDRQPTEHEPATGGWYRNDLHATALPTLALAKWARSIAAQSHGRPVALRLISDESASEGS